MKFFGYEVRKIKKEKILIIRNNYVRRDYVRLMGNGWSSYDYDFFVELMDKKIQELLDLNVGLSLQDISKIVQIFLSDADITVNYIDIDQ